MDHASLGLLDKPIEALTEDTLDLQEHALALSRFVLGCDTAMTIAIQGDWGSGKTSMMGMIKSILASAEHGSTIRRTAWINTWELAQFGQAENLPILLLSELTAQLSDADCQKAANLKRVLRQVGKASLFAAAAAVGHRDTLQAAADQLTADGGAPDVVALVRQLKGELRALVDQTTSGDRRARVVVFIDDLDRLVPVRAVELLEVMKVFLDIPGCVFLLACDYQVVMKGLTAKFGVSEAQLSGKSFFDKIIQVPYTMPVHRYKVDRYVRAALERVCDEWPDSDVQLLRQVLDTSTGFNPRSLKRIMNALLLMKDITSKDTPEFGKEREWVRILFAILCLQTAYPPLFQLLCSLDLSERQLRELQDPDRLRKNPDLERLLPKDGTPPPDWQAMGQFMVAFFKVLQLDCDQSQSKLSEQELHVLHKLLDSSNVVAVQPKTSPRARTLDDFAQEFLAKCEGDDQALEFFSHVFEYISENGIRWKPGSQGLSLWDKAGEKSLMWLYPTSGTTRQPVYFRAGEYDDGLCERLKPILPAALHPKIDERVAFSVGLRELTWAETKRIFDVLFEVNRAES